MSAPKNWHINNSVYTLDAIIREFAVAPETGTIRALKSEQVGALTP
jgi:hypothetical protein